MSSARVRRVWLTCTAVLVLLAATHTPAGAVPARLAKPVPSMRPTQKLAFLLRAHGAFSEPDRRSARLEIVRANRPITAERTALPVLGQTVRRGLSWLHVRLPGRPNGRTGWITKRGTLQGTTNWHVVVRRSSRLVIVYRKTRRVRAFKAIVGKPSTPTPRGEFFVEESIQLPAYAVGAPFALALSARSNALQEFAGGPGQIALHGRRNIGGVLGTAASHGCVRVADRAIRWLSERIGPGVPVTITS